MNFVSFAELSRDVGCWIEQNPQWHELAGVVGIPRSGMIPTAMIALRLNLPLSDLESFMAQGGRFYPARHGKPSDYAPLSSDSKTILLVDDSVSAGATMAWALGELSRMRLPWQFKPVAVYGPKDREYEGIDYYRRIESPRMFEWNWTRSTYLDDAMLDFDGVLCEDPEPFISRDRSLYERWLRDAQPLHIPLRRFRAVVSARLERYRGVSEEWLHNNYVSCADLYLIDATEEEREAGDLYWKHKAHHYGNSASPLFVESCPAQAKRIHEATGKVVIVPPQYGKPAIVYK